MTGAGTQPRRIGDQAACCQRFNRLRFALGFGIECVPRFHEAKGSSRTNARRKTVFERNFENVTFENDG